MEKSRKRLGRGDREDVSWADWMAWWIGKTCWQAGNPGDNRCKAKLAAGQTNYQL